MWIASKLTSPAPLCKSIQRTRILKELEIAHRYKVVLFQSAAGYGKTTAAAQWLAKTNNLGWFNIDCRDNDPIAFSHYFLSALNHATKGHCEKSVSIVEKNQCINLISLFTLALNEIMQWQAQSFLVLDDYHLIQDEDIHTALSYFIKHMPQNLTIVITSRTPPNLGIANLRVRCQLLEVENDLLAFNNEETHRFLSQFSEKLLDETMTKTICSQVEGWPSALQLIALNTKKTNRLPKVLSHELAHLWDYLAEEVFVQFNQENRHFLIQCSILSHFNHQIVSLVTGESNVLDKLSEFNKHGLLLCQTDATDTWYRFHNLFAQFLCHQRKRLMPEKEEALRALAVEAWIKADKLEQALSCAMDSSNNKLKLEVLLTQGWKIFNHGDLRLLNQALENLSLETLFIYPSLVFLKAWLLQAQHKYNEAGQLLEQSIIAFPKRNIRLTSAEQGELYALMAQVAINQNQTLRALELSEKAFEHLPADSYHPRIVATLIVAESHYCQGKLNRAFSLMQQAEKLANQYGLYQQALWALLQQSEIDLARGLTHLALERLDKAHALINRHHLQQLPLYEFMLRIRALLMWHINDIDEAKKLADQSLDVMSYYDKSKSLPAITQLAKNALVKGELAKAQQYLNQCEKLLEQNECHLDWQANVSMAQLTLWQLKKSKEEAEKWLEKTETPALATNHFLQLQHRNIAKAHYILGQYSKTLAILNNILALSEKLDLVIDNQYNLCAIAVVLDKLGQQDNANEMLNKALNLSTHSGIVACFYLEPVTILPILNRIIRQKELDKLVRHQAKTLIDSMSQHNSARALHFDESIVKKLLASDRLPDAIKTSPLTHREWQVMGLIYSGYSNDQISYALDVAPTTIKTHIRNLYQKLQIANREQAINLAERLIKTIHY